jgi:hypothetical protein
MRGVSRSSRTLSAGCGGRLGARDECANGGRRSRVVLTPRRWRQLARMLCIAPGWWQESPITRESTKEAVKTIRAGKAGLFRRACGDLLACFLILHARLRVRKASGFSCALCFEGTDASTTRAKLATGMRMRGCLTIESIGVVPDKRATQARSGTHNHRPTMSEPLWLQRVELMVACGYGSPPSRGR